MVVADPESASVDSYGPMPAPTATRMADDLCDLLGESGFGDVSVVVGRLHVPDGPGHPEDP